MPASEQRLHDEAQPSTTDLGLQHGFAPSNDTQQLQRRLSLVEQHAIRRIRLAGDYRFHIQQTHR